MLSEARLKAEASAALAHQAKALPNPRAELEVEEFDRAGNGMDDASVTVSLEQDFPAWGTRSARSKQARLVEEAGGLELAAAEAEVFASLLSAYAEHAAARLRLDLGEKAAAIEARNLQAVQGKVAAGREPPYIAVQAEAELELKRLDLFRLSNAVHAAARMLAAQWGGEPEGIDSSGMMDLDFAGVEPDWNGLEQQLDQSPLILRGQVREEEQRAQVAFETAAGRPGFSLRTGYQRVEEDGEDSLLFSVGVPLPLFDRNVGGTAAAKAEILSLQADNAKVRRETLGALFAVRDAFYAERQQVETLEGRVLPAVRQAVEAATEGYGQGKQGLLEMLDAQAGLNDVELQLVNARQAVLEALAAACRILGPSFMLGEN